MEGVCILPPLFAFKSHQKNLKKFTLMSTKNLRQPVRRLYYVEDRDLLSDENRLPFLYAISWAIGFVVGGYAVILGLLCLASAVL